MSDLKVKIYADGADKAGILAMTRNQAIKGFTTNPTLMRKAGVSNYSVFAMDILAIIGSLPISFEVFSDDLEEMYEQSLKIASWGENVYVKLPVTNTKGQSVVPLIRRLAPKRVKMNVTAVFTKGQVEAVSDALADAAPSKISVFAGRIADTGIDPMPTMRYALSTMARSPQQELIWASPRELFNVAQADAIGCHIITCTGDIIAKLPTLGKDLDVFSLETVEMFRKDAVAAGFSI